MIEGTVSGKQKLAGNLLQVLARDGVGIKKIEQTTESTADNGENVFKVTMTDDSSYELVVRNGSQGPQGLQGPQGPRGPMGPEGRNDWETMDNKPFYSNGMQTVELVNETLTYVEDMNSYMMMTIVNDMSVGETYTVNYNGTAYECVTQDLSAMLPNAIGLGNLLALDSSFVGNDEPFVLIIIPGGMAGIGGQVMPIDGATEITLVVSQTKEDIHKLDNKFLDLDWIPKESVSEEVVFDGLLHFGTSSQKMYDADFPFLLEAGSTYVINWNGDVYEGSAKSKLIDDSTGDIVENVYIGGWEDTGENEMPLLDLSSIPFAVLQLQSYDTKVVQTMLIHAANASDSDVEVTVVQRKNKIEPIPKKFLPSGTDRKGYYIDFMGAINGDNSYLYTNKYCSITETLTGLQEVVDNLQPIVIAMVNDVDTGEIMAISQAYAVTVRGSGNPYGILTISLNGTTVELHTAEYEG